jgi:hypothetical protein
MSVSSIALRRLPLLSTSSALPRARLFASHLTRHTPAFSQTTFKMDKDQSRGESTSGISEWKQRPPYRVHDEAADFDTKYEANCHCGKVKYQLSRREPLDSKLCHCTTCQTQHGMCENATISYSTNLSQLHRSSGPLSSTRMTSTSLMATTTLSGTTPLRSRSSTSFPAKCAARTAILPSWTRDVT